MLEYRINICMTSKEREGKGREGKGRREEASYLGIFMIKSNLSEEPLTYLLLLLFDMMSYNAGTGQYSFE